MDTKDMIVKNKFKTGISTHRVNIPIIQEILKDTPVIYGRFLKPGIYFTLESTDDGYALKEYFDSDRYVLKAIRLFNHTGVLESKTSSAVTCFNRDGELSGLEYRINGRLHRENGPALVFKSSGKEDFNEFYFTHGEPYDESDYDSDEYYDNSNVISNITSKLSIIKKMIDSPSFREAKDASKIDRMLCNVINEMGRVIDGNGNMKMRTYDDKPLRGMDDGDEGQEDKCREEEELRELADILQGYNDLDDFVDLSVTDDVWEID